MTEPKRDLARLRPLFALAKMSQQLQSDVLADGSIISACDITAKQQIHLPRDISLIREELFSAFRDKANSPTLCQLHDPDGALIDAVISINKDGSGTLDVAENRMHFPWVTLLSSDLNKRGWWLDQFLGRYPLSDGDAESLRALLAHPDYSVDDFLTAAKILDSSPETFTERLADKLRHQNAERGITAVDLLPDDDRYWNHLLPPISGSEVLADYVAKELLAAWQKGITADAAPTLHRLAITFAAPELVPRTLLHGLSIDAAEAAVNSVSEVADPFSLIGAFEICADRIGQDGRFVALGDRLLDNLFGNMQRLLGTCAVFGATFIVTTAHFAMHETLQRRPVYWRRLAAAAHASLVVRVGGGDGVNPKDIIAWATRSFGNAYFLSVFSDFAIEPQWRPEWILPKLLVVDIFGRAAGAWHRISQDTALSSWKERIEKAQSWVFAENIGAFAQYPSILQGTRRTGRPTLADFQDTFPQVADAFRELATKPTLDRLLSVTPIIEAFGFPQEANTDAEKLLAPIREAAPDEEDKTFLALSVLAHIAILAGNATFADAIAELCLERAQRTENPRYIFELVCRLVECSAATKDRAEAGQTLARRLEILAFVVPPSDAAQSVAAAIDMLRRIHPDLAPLLGRASAISRLGSPRTAA